MWKFLLEIFFQNSILLEIVENWHTNCQGHKKRCPHWSSLRVHLCPWPLPVFRAVLIDAEVEVKDFLDAAFFKYIPGFGGYRWHVRKKRGHGGCGGCVSGRGQDINYTWGGRKHGHRLRNGFEAHPHSFGIFRFVFASSSQKLLGLNTC